MKLENTRIILTGASSGIGKHLCEKLAQEEGVRILAVARHIEDIPAKNGTVIPFRADISHEEELERCFRFVEENWNGLDIFIANAGFAFCQDLSESEPEDVQKIFSTNVFSQIFALERFMASPGFKKGERYFVSTISAVAMFPLPYYALYCATKSALDGFLKTFAYEKPANLKILRVYPIATRTAFFQRAVQDIQPPLPLLRQNPEPVACAIAKALKKGMSRLYPSPVFRFLYPLMRPFPFLIRAYSLNEKKKMEKYRKTVSERT